MKDKVLKVDKEFLMKIAGQIDTLTKKVQELETPKATVFNTEQTFDSGLNLADNQKQFLAELGCLITKYKILRLTVNYRK